MIEVSPKEYQKSMAWSDARVYCFTLDIDGKVGWRLPTIKELIKLHNGLTKSNKYNLPRDYHWSGELRHSDTAWVVDLHTSASVTKYVTREFWVRPVRDI
jgi:hypothetical protein